MSKNLVFTCVRVRVQLSPLIDVTYFGVVLANSVVEGSYSKIYNFGFIFNFFVLMRCLNHRVPVYSLTCPEKSSRNHVLPREVEQTMIVSSIL